MTILWSDRRWLLLILILVLGTNFFAQAQVKKKIGKIQGVVKDSISLTNLPQATVAIYKKANNSLYKYRFNDGSGRFILDSIDVDTSFYLVVSFIGYRPYKKQFLLSNQNEVVNFGSILLQEDIHSLDEVSINLPPILMRGDTIEFNADAFKLDTAAVVGDLLKRLPGVIIWGDGKITVNGKNVRNLTVNGKTFFSGDVNLVMDNLPKSIVEKIQAIPTNTNDRLSDSIVTSGYDLNIKLKKGKESGIFGKIGVGVGNNKYYDSDIMLSFYSTNTQLSVVGGANNINRSATDINTMMLNSGFSQGSINKIITEPNFGQSGITTQRSGGLSWKNDWNKKISSQVQFYTYNTDLSISDNINRTLVLPDSLIISDLKRVGKTVRSEYTTSMLASYIPNLSNSLRMDFNVNNSFYDFNYYNIGNTKSSIFGKLNTTLGENKTFGEKSDKDFGIAYIHKMNKSNKLSKEDFDLLYKINQQVENFESVELSEVTPFISEKGQYFNRKKKSSEKFINHTIDLKYYSLMSLLGIFTRTSVDLDLDSYLNSNFKNKIVHNYNLNDNSYSLTNSYLSNDMTFDESTFKPSVNISRLFDRGISGRFYRSTLIRIGLKQRLSFQNSRSDKLFQNIDRSYNNFLPNINIRLKNNVPNKNEHIGELEYGTDVVDPTIDQLAPLIDSAQQVAIWRGNILLKQSYVRSFSFRYSFTSFKLNSLKIAAEIKGESIDHYISDSTFIDNIGRQIVTPINVNGYKNLYVQLNFSKPLLINGSPATFNIFPSFEYFYKPFYNNSLLVQSENQFIRLPLNFNYHIKSSASIELWGSKDILTTKLNNDGGIYNNFLSSFGFRGNILVLKKLNLSSSIRVNKNSGTGIASQTINIWNANLSYRFSKLQSYEVKMSVNDILNQNKGIANTVNGNVISFGEVNRLRRYFMINIAYFPRKFDFKGKK